MPVVSKHKYDEQGYAVRFSRADAIRWSKRWPCSTVRGAGSVEFDDVGNLVGLTGSAEKGDGHDWVAFVLDLQACANARHAEQRAWTFDKDNVFAKRHATAIRRAGREKKA